VVPKYEYYLLNANKSVKVFVFHVIYRFILINF